MSSLRLSQLALRGFAGFLGAYALMNVLGDLLRSRFDGNLSWIDLRFLPVPLQAVLEIISGLALLAYAFRIPRSENGHRFIAGVALLLVGATLHNTVQFFLLWSRHSIRPGIPVPLSLLLLAFFSLLAADSLFGERQQLEEGKGSRLAVAALAVVWALAFPILQMYSLGQTDYRRPADAAVVFGARVYADGRLSDALADRVATACELYRDKLVGKLLMSGGPGDGAIPEVHAMRDQAIRLGVSQDDILLDPSGVNTAATVLNTAQIAGKHGIRSIVLVSHFYHLPRAKMAFQRAGIDVVTVPAKERYILTKLPLFILREVAAYWVYYARS